MASDVSQKGAKALNLSIGKEHLQHLHPRKHAADNSSMVEELEYRGCKLFQVLITPAALHTIDLLEFSKQNSPASASSVLNMLKC